MGGTLRFNRSFLYFGIPIFLFMVLVFIMKSASLIQDERIVLGLIIDLLIIVPLVYLFLIRKSNIPKTTVVPVMIIGLVIGYSFMPATGLAYLDLFKVWMLPVVELIVVSFIVYKVRSAVMSYKALDDTTLDFFSAVKVACKDILPTKLITPFATEIAVFYYGFINWKKPIIRSNQFTYHKSSGSPALFGAFIFVILIETFVIHLLLMNWSSVLAWGLTILSVYTAFQVFGFARSLAKRPIELKKDVLSLKYGLMSETDIALSEIVRVDVSSADIEENVDYQSLSPIGKLESHNIVIHCKNSQLMYRVYGFKKPFRIVSLYVDNPTQFKELIDSKLRLLYNNSRCKVLAL